MQLSDKVLTKNKQIFPNTNFNPTITHHSQPDKNLLKRAIENPQFRSPEAILQLQQTIGNQAVMRLIKGDQVPQKTVSSVPNRPATVQRVLLVGNKYVGPREHHLLLREVKQEVEKSGGKWTTELEKKLENWLNSREYNYKFSNFKEMFEKFLGDEEKLTDKEKEPIKEENLKKGQQRRKRDRFSNLMEPYYTQTPSVVKGMANIPDEELLRLGDVDEEEKEHWLRHNKRKSLGNYKKRGISKEEEHRIVASGNEKDPSYVVWNPNMEHEGQRGHRYRSTKGTFNHSQQRTYGSKKEREDYLYKISGGVDGHSVQAQDDQKILGPYQKDVPHWKTTINTTEGTSISHDDSKYLPKNSKDTKWIEEHPYNFYWENQEQGKHVRQGAIEDPVMRIDSSFLHYNVYDGQTGNPNKDLTENIYPIPSTIHYLVKDKTSGDRTHYIGDNRLVADYSKPEKYNKKTNTYSNIDGKPSHTKNKTLGKHKNGERFKASEHLAMWKQGDNNGFPSATVLDVDKEDFDFQPKWRKSVKGYESPPSSPYHQPSYLEVKEKTEKGEKHPLQKLEEMLLDSVMFDEDKEESTLKLSKIPTIEPTNIEKAFKEISEDREKKKQKK